jgi:hypothetical protein
MERYMKKISLFFALLFLLYSCTSVGTNQQQVQDLSALGYPIVYKNPSFPGSGIMYVQYKNISEEVISEIVFTFQIGGTECSLRESDTLKPGMSRESGWGTTGGWERGFIRGVSVTFKSGRTVKFDNAMAMLDDKNYTSGYLAVTESPSPPVDSWSTEEFFIGKADPLAYIKKDWTDVYLGNYDYENESYNRDDYYWFNFSSEVFIKDAHGTGHSFVFYGENGNERQAMPSPGVNGRKNTADTYRILENSDFDPQKKYTVSYRLRSSGKRYSDSDSLYVDNIEGLLTYEQSQEKDKQKAAEEKQQELQRKQAEVKAAYEKALSSNGVAPIIEYIHTYQREDDFNKDCYAEIARRITKNRNAAFKQIYTAPNPYAFDTKTVYYCSSLTVQSFTKGTIIAYTGNVFISDEDVVFLSSVPDIKDIGRSIPNAYLKYNGTTVLASASGRKREVPSFDLIYSFE